MASIKTTLGVGLRPWKRTGLGCGAENMAEGESETTAGARAGAPWKVGVGEGESIYSSLSVVWR